MLTTILRCFKTISPRTHRRRSVARPASAGKLRLEALEDRCLLSYAITDLGTLPGCEASNASDVNAAGQVVGNAIDYDTHSAHSFLWDKNTGMIDLGTLGGPSSIANAINDAGQVVGSSTIGALDAFGNSIWHAFLWENGVMTDLGLEGSATGINASGQIVGNDALGAFLRDRVTGTTTHLGTLAGYTGSSASDINDAGQVAGIALFDDPAGGFVYTLGFLWTPATPDGTTGEMAGIYAPWSDATVATGINSTGDVVGHASGVVSAGWGPSGGDDGGGASADVIYYYYAFICGGSLMPLSTPLGEDSFAYDINDIGQVVGTAGVPGTAYAALWQSGVLSNLNLQIPPDSGWSSLYAANAINDSGQIAGNGALTVQGQVHAFLLTPELALNVGDVTVTEGNIGTRNAVFPVSLSAASDQTVTVAYATVDGTATAGSDYQTSSGTLSFAPGETSKNVTVLVNGDRLGEPNENFFVSLSGATNATIADGQGVGTILDDEPRISINDVTKKEGSRGQTTLFMFTITLSAPYDQAVTMSFRTVDGTAKAGEDYVAKTGTLTFNAGETTKTITIEVKGDSKKEANETFYLDLFGNSDNSLFTKNRGIGMILNDD